MTGEGTYVLGIEPATCRVGGRKSEVDAGRVIHLEPGESRLYRLEIVASEGRENEVRETSSP